MPYYFASVKQLRLGFTNHIWAVGIIDQKKAKLTGLDYVALQDVPVRCLTERQTYYPQCVW